MAVFEGEQGRAAHAEASSSSSNGEAEYSHVDFGAEDSYTEAALEPALELTPQRRGKPVEELSAEEANDMTCAICLDQIPVPELCAIKGCDHVYCGAWRPCSLAPRALEGCVLFSKTQESLPKQ